MSVVIRKASAEDLELLISLRLDYFRADMGWVSPEMESTLTHQLREYIPKHLAAGDFIAVLAEEDGVVLSTASLIIVEKPANPSFPNGKTGTLLNVLTYPQHRRNGYAEKVVCMLIAEAKKAGVTMLELSATKHGEPLYRKLGFMSSPCTPMKLKLI